jgi:hypothetical protein
MTISLLFRPVIYIREFSYHKGAFPKNDVQSLTAHPFQSTVQESWYGFRTVLTHTEYLYHALARS